MKRLEPRNLLLLMGVLFFILAPVLTLFSSSVAAAGNSETIFIATAEGAASISEENDSDTDAPGFDEDWDLEFAQVKTTGADPIPFLWNLKTGLRNHFSTDPDFHFSEANKKNEISFRLETTWGSAPLSFFAATEGHFFTTFLDKNIGDDYPYSMRSETHRNLRITSRDAELVFREMYINYDANDCRLRIGNQVFPWGTADFINPTAYLNPMDLREFIFKDEAEVRFGIPACSAIFFFDAFTTEFVFAPVHVPPALPPTGHFWAIKALGNNTPVILGEPEERSVSSRNFGYGGRVSATLSNVDASFSAYHGPDKDQLLVPFSIVIQENPPVSLFLQPESFIVDYAGVDIALTHGDFVFQVEAAFSPNKRGIVRQDTDRPFGLKFPFDTRKCRFYSYSVGLNYFIPMYKLIPGHAGESLFTAEWYQARYDDDDINRPLIPDFLALRYQDGFFDDRFKVSVTQLLTARDHGLVWWPQIGYDFKNGFEMELAYISIYGRGRGDFSRDSLFYYYRDNDFIMLNFRYAFP